MADTEKIKLPKENQKIRLDGLVEETKKMHMEHQGSPKMMHESSVKASTRMTNGTYQIL